MCLRRVTYSRIPGKRLSGRLLSQRTEKRLATEPKKTRFTYAENSRKKGGASFLGETPLFWGALSSASGLLLCAEALALFANVVSQ